MFGFLKKKNKKAVTEQLLIAIFEKLPGEYRRYLQQLNEGVIRDVSCDSSSAPERISILFNTVISKRYDDEKLRGTDIEGIYFKDLNSNTLVEIKVYLYSGLVSGIDCEKSLQKCNIDFSSISVDHAKIKHDKVDDAMQARLSGFGITNFNDSEIYETSSDGVAFIHLRDLDDGDFLAVNEQGFYIVSIALQENIKIESKHNQSLQKDFLSLPKETVYSFISS